MILHKLKDLSSKAIVSLKTEGIIILTKKIIKYTLIQLKLINTKDTKEGISVKDVLFINGCFLEHPTRYRVYHQMQQLESNNITCDTVWYADLKEYHLENYKCFIIFRAVYTEELEKFIKKARNKNKKIFFDMDDLVFERKYVDTLDHVKKMNKEDYKQYIYGVEGLKKTMKLCDYGITTTMPLAQEMNKHLQDICINRNVASDEMAKLSDIAIENNVTIKDDIVLGYFSGSISHNADFDLIKETIKKILIKYPNVKLLLTGIIDVPDDFNELKEQIIIEQFVDWKKLPELIAKADINLIPLVENFHNICKSENKWTEASLVRIPSIASNIGAFSEMITNNVDGILVNNKSWFNGLERLILDRQLRNSLGLNAYKRIQNEKLTYTSGLELAEFIKKYTNNNIGFILPSTNVSGGVNVALKHGTVLHEKGYNVFFLTNENKEDKLDIQTDERFKDFSLIFTKDQHIYVWFNTLVATLWSTTEFATQYWRKNNIKYLVQNYEPGFYGYYWFERSLANRTYSLPNVDYITISKWCQKWLKEKYKKDARYIPNGIDTNQFSFQEKDFSKKIIVLIEGNSSDKYKNVDDSFKVTNKLDKKKYEIWYMSYASGPKEWYKYDKYLSKVPYAKVHEIYKQCHILIKTSLLESFSYPPLEMMATGGIAILSPNGGNIEYCKNNYNCLMFDVSNHAKAKKHLENIISNKILRAKLISNGLKTAKQRDWKYIEENIYNAYHNE